MLLKNGDIDSTPILDCPICNGNGKPLPEYAAKGMIRCPCILHAYVCPWLGSKFTGIKNSCNCREMLERLKK